MSSGSSAARLEISRSSFRTLASRSSSLPAFETGTQPRRGPCFLEGQVFYEQDIQRIERKDLSDLIPSAQHGLASEAALHGPLRLSMPLTSL
jgi:hypothetical protein